jgi:hypothetical protein
MKTLAVLPNAGMILVQKEYSHTLLLPCGSECVDRPVAEYFPTANNPSGWPHAPETLWRPMRREILRRNAGPESLPLNSAD